MGKHTPFYDLHVKANAKMVDFAGWDMPLHYGSQIEEHHQVRHFGGMFDVSHMGVVDIKGDHARKDLCRLVANDINRLIPGKALYTCMLNEDGGIIDDLIIYELSDQFYRLVVNAGTREKDIAWIQSHLSPGTQLTNPNNLVILALQGPAVLSCLEGAFNEADYNVIKSLKPFHCALLQDLFIARTGYTGEEGYELIFPAEKSVDLWNNFISLGIKPCGLGARDTLRLEAGLNLYGSDMDENITPFEANLSWTVSLDGRERDFIGKEALLRQKARGVSWRLTGLVLTGPGIMRNHQKVFTADKVGEITSGGYSPTLAQSIALARIPNDFQGDTCLVGIRDKKVPAKIVKPPFVRYGKKIF